MAYNSLIPQSGGGGSGTVDSVTGLNTDNTDPANPIVRISVDGVTITGAGTLGSPLVAATGGSGDVTGPASSTDNAIARFNGATGKVIQNSGASIDDTGNLTANNFSGSSSGTNTGDQTITLTGDVTGSGTGSFAATIGANKVTAGKMSASATDVLFGRSTAGAGAGEEIPCTAFARTILDDVDAAAVRATIGAGTGSGTVTAVSVASANGLAGSSSGGATPALTLSTTVTGVLKGNGTAISAAVSGTDYCAATSGSGILKGSSGNTATATAGVDYSAGTSALSTGILKSTTSTGALTIAVAGDFPTLNQNTTGSAATLTTPRAIYGNNFDGSAALTQVIASTYGGTGNGFTKFSGPTTSEKTFTLPNASATVLTDNATVTVPQGGTGVATLTGLVKGNGTSAFSAASAGTDYTDAAFKTISVSGQSDVVADSAADTLTLAAGANITITTNATTDTITIAASGSTGYGTIQEEGLSLTQRATMNFVGGGITAADDAGNSRTNITLDSTLNSLAAYNTNGLLTQTAADTFTGRTLTGGGGVTVSNGDGVSGNPTLGISALQSLWVPAAAIRPSSSGGCAALALVATAANQPDISSLDFDSTTAEYAQFGVSFPKGWDEGTVTAQFYWSHAATTTNFGVRWGLQGVAVSDDDTIAVAYGTAQEVTDTGGTTNDLYVSSATSAITIAGTPAAGDEVFFRVYRDPANAGDTMAIDARLMGVKVFYTINTLDDA